MVRTSTFLIAVWLCVNAGFAQQDQKVWESFPFRDGSWQSGAQQLDSLQPSDGLLSYYLTWEGPKVPRLSIRFSAGTGSGWMPWQQLEPFSHNPGKRISRLYFAGPATRAYELRVRDPQLQKLSIYFYHPGKHGAPALQKAEPQAGRACPCPLPERATREAWCPNNECPPNPDPLSTDVTHLIVHHSDTPNSSDDWPAVVRAIWNFHVNGNGWSDIGYNYLIDPTGLVYEGRGNDVLGAHFCGQNTNTLGVCLLGDFTDRVPSLEARLALAELLAWKTCAIGADPLDTAFHAPSGLNLPRISGHRDGCATSCPGDRFYPLLPDIRTYVSDWITSGCDPSLGPVLLAGEEQLPGTVFLQWADNSSLPVQYELQRAEASDSVFFPLATLPGGSVFFADTNYVAGEIYGYRLRAFAGADTSAWSNAVWVTTDPTSSLNPPQADAALKLFPNPVQDRLSVQWRGTAPEVLQLVNGQGQVVRRKTGLSGAGSFQLSVAGLPAGYYVLQLTAGGRLFAQRLLIKH